METDDPRDLRTDQEMFDYVARKLYKQGRQCRNRYGFCALRGDRGDKCALGWLIPDELYETSYESLAIILTDLLAVVPLLRRFNPQLLAMLREAHDATKAAPTAKWLDQCYAELSRVAGTFKLDTTTLNEVFLGVTDNDD